MTILILGKPEVKEAKERIAVVDLRPMNVAKKTASEHFGDYEFLLAIESPFRGVELLSVVGQDGKYNTSRI